MAERPTDVPEWASDPPADTLTTPSSQQRAEGWQPLQAQVERVQVTTVANATLYRATINGVNHDYTSDGSATATEIRDGLRTAINGGTEPVTAANDGADALTLTADVTGTPFTLAVTANLTRTTTAENSTGRPRRQFMNWLFELVYRWILFLRDAVFRSSDIAPDQAFGGAAPAVAVGLTVAANSFRASGYIDGYRVAEVQAPAHTYAATSDTYWDLGRDGVWRAVVVASGDPEPAVTSSPPSVRVFRVRTNATNRTLVDDRRRARVALSGALDVLAGLRLGVDRDEFTAATVTTIPADGVGATYSLIDQWTADVGGPNEHSVRVYVTGTVADRRVIIVHGAVWQGGAGDPWLAEVDDPRRMDLMPVLRTSRMSVNAGDTFNDSTWWSAGDNLLSVGSSTNITGNASTTGALAVGSSATVSTQVLVGAGGTGRLPLLQGNGAAAIADGAVYVPIVDDGESTLYRATNALAVLGPAFLLARNARYNRDASVGSEWERRTLLEPASLTVWTRSGERRFTTSHTTAAWANAIGSAAWGAAPGMIALSAAAAGHDAGVTKHIDGPNTADAVLRVGAGVEGGAWWEIDPPHGSTLLTSLMRATNPVGSQELRAGVVRVGLASGTAQYLSASGTFTVLTEDGTALGARTIDMGAALADRVVDRANYRYAVIAMKTDGGTGLDVEIQEVRVTYDL